MTVSNSEDPTVAKLQNLSKEIESSPKTAPRSLSDRHITPESGLERIVSYIKKIVPFPKKPAKQAPIPSKADEPGIELGLIQKKESLPLEKDLVKQTKELRSKFQNLSNQEITKLESNLKAGFRGVLNSKTERKWVLSRKRDVIGLLLGIPPESKVLGNASFVEELWGKIGEYPILKTMKMEVLEEEIKKMSLSRVEVVKSDSLTPKDIDLTAKITTASKILYKSEHCIDTSTKQFC